MAFAVPDARILLHRQCLNFSAMSTPGGGQPTDATTTAPPPVAPVASASPSSDAAVAGNAAVVPPKTAIDVLVALRPSLSSRALAAGGAAHHHSTSVKHGSSGGAAGSSVDFHKGSSAALQPFVRTEGGLARSDGKFLVVGDGFIAPLMALCLRAHGLECDLAHAASTSDADRGTIVLTPSVTQVMGDLLGVSVPSGSVIGRILTFDHIGNDMSDLDLNEFREKGESPTFFACDRPKIESSLLSLCRMGNHSCNVLANGTIDKGGLESLDTGVRVTFATGVSQDYRAVICTARNQALIPELTLTNEELQQRQENAHNVKMGQSTAHRWLEVCVPPLPEIGKFEKRFTPGSQEIVELMTPRDAKMCVRPTMLATKLFYNVHMTIPDHAQDPRLKNTSLKTFWDDVVEHWTSGIPGYVSHTMFKPMFSHVQQHFSKTTALVYRTPDYLIPHWQEGGGRIIKIGHAAHSTCADAIDITDALAVADCFGLARTLSLGGDVPAFLKERRLTAMEVHDHHQLIQYYSLKERGQMKYAASRFGMKILRRYKKSWRSILQHFVTMLPKTPKL